MDLCPECDKNLIFFLTWSLAASGQVFARSTENFQLAGTWQGFVSQLFTNDPYGVLKRFDKCFNIG